MSNAHAPRGALAGSCLRPPGSRRGPVGVGDPTAIGRGGKGTAARCSSRSIASQTAQEFGPDCRVGERTHLGAEHVLDGSREARLHSRNDSERTFVSQAGLLTIDCRELVFDIW